MKDFFVERYKAWGWEYIEVQPQQAIRINTTRSNPEAVKKRLQKKGIFLEKSSIGKYAYTTNAEQSPGSTEEYLLGHFYMQDPVTQYAVEVLDPQRNEKILDMCAAPGGKTTYIAQLMNNTGIIHALDIDKKRCQILQNNCERCHCENITIFQKDVREFPTQEYDRVLLDAPCSGNVSLEKDWFEKRIPRDIRMKSITQRKFLEKAFKCTKKGGLIVYCTCSLEREENEENSIWFQETFPVKKQMEKRFWPTEEHTGFYVASFIKEK